MKVGSLLSVACAAVALGAGAFAAEPHIGKFVSYERQEFTDLHHAQRRPGAAQFIEDLGEVSRRTREDARQARPKNTAADAHRHRERTANGRNICSPARTLRAGSSPARFSNYMVMDGDAARGAALQLDVSRVHALLPGVAIRRRISALVQRRPGRAHGLREIRSGQGRSCRCPCGMCTKRATVTGFRSSG